jgi:hypothetical protein
MLATVLMAALAGGACDNGPSTAPTPPTTPSVTETFTGTVNLNGAVVHSFSAQSAGAVTATITAIDPSASLVGFQLGTWFGSTCSIVVSNDLATLSSVLSGITQSRADLCVRLHDPNGILTANPVTYTVQVVHQ